MTPTLTFVCSICGEPSVSICVYCTKDACPNHLCDRCRRCSDCCECDIRLDEHTDHEGAHEAGHAAGGELAFEALPPEEEGVGLAGQEPTPPAAETSPAEPVAPVPVLRPGPTSEVAKPLDPLDAAEPQEHPEPPSQE